MERKDVLFVMELRKIRAKYAMAVGSVADVTELEKKVFLYMKGNKMLDAKHLLKDHAYRNIPLSFEEAYELGLFTLEGCNGDELAKTQSIAILSALHNQATYSNLENAANQIAGICAAIFEHDIKKSEFGFLNPRVDYAMDNCGMGGDLVVTANVSTIAALIAATAGIPMCKHGSPANADGGKHGSSDFMVLCDIDIFPTKTQAENCLEKLNFVYTEALDTRYKQIHLQTHKIAKLPHMNDIIGPITNPLNPKLLTRRVLGVNHLISPCVVAQAYHVLNQKGITNLKHGLFVRGFIDEAKTEGIDEISICKGGTQVAELKNGKIREFRLIAKSFGIDPILPKFVSPPPGISKGDFSLAVLEKRASISTTQMIIANAAPLFYLAGRSQNWRECYQMAEKVFFSGDVCERLSAIQKMLPKK